MTAAWKRWIARKLCPGVFVDAERWYLARMHLDDLDKWCSVDFPVIGEAARWVLKGVNVYFMPLDEFYAKPPAWHASERVKDISGFREDLRRANGLDPIRGRNAPTPAPSTAEVACAPASAREEV